MFEIEQDCRQFGGPKVEGSTERSTIRVDGPDRYTDMTDGGNESFRLCPGLKP
ncbi:protein of unassigned function [Methylobacterium oryzae CBMB20]|uniref:Protein of unassigned function n=1 Tax=Methylobacterium oryzae CBMB20 TaxID=693986 RepID=A0A089NP50_9HYPH|nr:protein of unassigned function [Methylobacterium oryzae CBMB20]